MTPWTELYKDKLITAQDAVTHIKSGDRVMFGHAAGEPLVLVDAMVANYKQYRDVEIIHWVPMGKGEYTKPEMAGHFIHNALFVGSPTRQAVTEKRADFTPCFFSETPRMLSEYMKVDVALIQVSPPDKHGFCSLGVSVCATKPGAQAANLVIAEVNDQIPRTYGDSFMHISEFDYIVEASHPLPELSSGIITDVERKIGEYCAELIEDESTLQLGIGTIPDAVLSHLDDKKDLGIHSEMFSDGVVKLYEKGIITNAKKGINKGKMVVGFLMGTKMLYDFVDNNPVVEMRTIDYVNNPVNIMQNNKMVAINSCLQVDFTGQVNSESIGPDQFSGMGGQVDFVRGCSLCPGGKAIIAMPSTAKKGELSRIVPFLDYGSAVTTSRGDVHYIVTEYGIAQLRGKSLRQRAKALINIAHPKFRDQLEKDFTERFGRR
jgi:4-hydroxybutyrate CoA-transferase